MRMARRIAVAAALVSAAGVAGVWLLASQLSAPAPARIGAPPSSLAAETLRFPSESGGAIAAWLVRGRPGRGVLVLAHSVRSNRLEMLERAGFLARAGYSVLLFDAQAHGESPGKQITFGHLEAFDAAAAVAFVRRDFAGEPVVYLGVSQGGAAALLGPSPLPVDGLILEAVYPTLREAVENRVAIRLGPLARLLAPLLLLQVGPRLGVDPDEIAPIEGIRRIHAPLLLIAGERDRHTTLEQSHRLFDAAPEPKTLWVVPGAAHVNFHHAERAEYERRVLEFLARTIESTPASP